MILIFILGFIEFSFLIGLYVIILHWFDQCKRPSR